MYYSGQPLQLTQEEIQAGVLRVKRHLSVSSDKHVHVGQYTITSAYMVVCDLSICYTMAASGLPVIHEWSVLIGHEGVARVVYQS